MCYCDPSNPFTGKSCGKEKCRTWEYHEAMRELTAERDALKAETDELKFELSGCKNVKADLARLLNCEDEPRWKWIVLEVSTLIAELEAARKQEPIGSVTVQRWRGIDSMINTDFDAVQNLPDGTYQCYASPVPAQQLPDDARYIIDPRLNEDGEYYIRGKDINAILKGGENEQNQEENTIDAWYARMKGKYL